MIWQDGLGFSPSRLRCFAFLQHGGCFGFGAFDLSPFLYFSFLLSFSFSSLFFSGSTCLIIPALRLTPFVLRLSLLTYFHSFPMLTSLSSCLFRTLAVARSKSSCVTCTRRSRRAYMPASVHTPFSSAPEQPFIFSAILVRLIPRVRFMLRLWIRRMSARASTLCSPGLALLARLEKGWTEPTSGEGTRSFDLCGPGGGERGQECPVDWWP